MNQPPIPGSNADLGGNAPGEAGKPSPAGLGELRSTVSEVLRVVSVRRWMFFIPFCLVTTAAFILSLYVPRRYTASTKFERRDDPVLVNLPSAGGMGAFELYRGTVAKDIKGVEALTEVVRNLGLADSDDDQKGPGQTDPAARQARIRAIASGISSRLQVLFHKTSPHLDVIEILYTSPSPDGLAELLDTIRETYIRRTRERFEAKLRETRDWFDQQRDKRWEMVSALERDLDAYRTEHLGINPLDLNESLIHLATLRRDVVRLERKQKEFETKLDGRRRLLAARAPAPLDPLSANRGIGLRPPPIRRSAETRRLAAELHDVRSKIEQLGRERGMTELHPDMIALRAQERTLAGDLREQEQRDARSIVVNGMAQLDGLGPAPEPADDPWAATRAQIENDVRIYEQLVAENTAELKAARAKVNAYEAAREAALGQYRAFRNRSADVARAKKEMEMYQGYSDQIGRVLSAEGAQRGVRFEKIKPATTSPIPASPRITTVIIFSTLAGLVAGIVLMLVTELFDRTVRAHSQIVHDLGLPILESIDEIVSAVARRRRLLKRMILVPAVATSFLFIVLLSGTVAYLSLHNRPLYQRVMQAPRAALRRVAGISRPADSLSLARGGDQEHRG